MMAMIIVLRFPRNGTICPSQSVFQLVNPARTITILKRLPSSTLCFAILHAVYYTCTHASFIYLSPVLQLNFFCDADLMEKYFCCYCTLVIKLVYQEEDTRTLQVSSIVFTEHTIENNCRGGMLHGRTRSLAL